MHYSAAWTDSGFLLGCSHEHEAIAEADSCIPCAGGYVVALENGVMRSLTAQEEAEFQRVHYAPLTNNPVSESEREELERMCAENDHALMDALEKRFYELLRVKAGCQ